MGCGQSAATGATSIEDQDALKKTHEIDQQIKRDKEAERRQIKLLLLGAGESGKSTILKQARLRYQGTYSDRERQEYALVVHANLLQSMQVVLEAVQTLGLTLNTDDEKRKANAILDCQLQEQVINPIIAQAIAQLWQNAAVREAVRRRREFQLNDSAEYYFDATERITAPGYLPTDDDILRSRVKTTGINETTFKVGEYTWRLFDVGGQRSERRKWVHCFEGVNVLLFLIAISEFDQALYEDNTVSRISEAGQLFSSVVNSRWFAQTTIILFLNKIDILRAKLTTSRLSDYVPEYQGDNSFENVATFFIQHFRSMYSGEKPMYQHLTQATDTRQISVVLAAVNDSVLRSNLSNAGYL